MSVQQGFLLTRHARDVSGQTQIDLWLSTDNGPVQLVIPGEKPVFFIPQDDIKQCQTLIKELSIQAEIKPIALHSFDDVKLAACYCLTVKDGQRLSQKFKHHDILVLEDDIRLADRYLMERFVQGSVEFAGHPQPKKNYTRFSSVKCRQGHYTPQLKVVSLDIECSEKGVLYSIGLDSPMDSRVIMIGEPQAAETAVEWVQDEKHLLLSLITWFQQFDPDVIVGWNVYLNLHIY